MSSKPGRIRKALNRDLTSLAIPALLPIDPQLLALDNSTLTNDKSDILLDCVVVDYTLPISASPKSKQISRISKAFADKYEPTNELIDKPTPQDELEPELKPVITGVKSLIQWSFLIKQTLFNKLLH